jgi:hypothetical protein
VVEQVSQLHATAAGICKDPSISADAFADFSAFATVGTPERNKFERTKDSPALASPAKRRKQKQKQLRKALLQQQLKEAKALDVSTASIPATATAATATATDASVGTVDTSSARSGSFWDTEESESVRASTEHDTASTAHQLSPEPSAHGGSHHRGSDGGGSDGGAGAGGDWGTDFGDFQCADETKVKEEREGKEANMGAGEDCQEAGVGITIYPAVWASLGFVTAVGSAVGGHQIGQFVVTANTDTGVDTEQTPVVEAADASVEAADASVEAAALAMPSLMIYPEVWSALGFVVQKCETVFEGVKQEVVQERKKDPGWEKGKEVIYTAADGTSEQVTILRVHREDVELHYSIMVPSTKRERQTTLAKLREVGGDDEEQLRQEQQLEQQLEQQEANVGEEQEENVGDVSSNFDSSEDEDEENEVEVEEAGEAEDANQEQERRQGRAVLGEIRSPASLNNSQCSQANDIVSPKLEALRSPDMMQKSLDEVRQAIDQIENDITHCQCSPHH